MTENIQLRRKRTRAFDSKVIPDAMFLDNNDDSDPMINDMLQQQSLLLDSNILETSYSSLVDDTTSQNFWDLGMQQSYFGNTPDNINYISFKKVKKQRTISLPQLPHSKLFYHSKDTKKKTQNDEELINLQGSTSKTIEKNRFVRMKIIKSISPLNFVTPTDEKNFLASHINNWDNSRGYRDFKTSKDGHYIYRDNDIFADGRFITQKLLGQGTFGKVVRCFDSQNPSRVVAVKIIRAVDRYREAAKTELRVLETIRRSDPTGHFQCLILRECFDYRSHICLVTDLFGRSVYEFMYNNGYPRFPGSHVQAISKQLIRSVCFLHDLGIVHTDLKPENILLCDESYVEKDLSEEVVSSLSLRRKETSGGKRRILTNPEVKLIDFGSAVFVNEYHPALVSTRHYRAPEIILGLGWSFPCDVWSIGCVMIELVTGESLYPIHENLEHMAMMERINGEHFPAKMVEKMFYKAEKMLGNVPPDLQNSVLKHFDKNNLSLQWPELNDRGDIITKEKSLKRVISSCDRLDKHISAKLSRDYGDWFVINWDLSLEENWELIQSRYLGRRSLSREVFIFWYWFIDLIKQMFNFDPTTRISARDAMDHEWFSLGILDEGISCYGKS